MTEKKPKLMPYRRFLHKLSRSLATGLAIIAFSLLLGMVGYHYIEKMSWVDSYESAAMILSGMGPTEALHTNAGKIFAGSYALFSGIVFLVVIAIIFAPLVHRFFHHFHIDSDKEK